MSERLDDKVWEDKFIEKIKGYFVKKDSTNPIFKIIYKKLIKTKMSSANINMKGGQIISRAELAKRINY